MKNKELLEQYKQQLKQIESQYFKTLGAIEVLTSLVDIDKKDKKKENAKTK